MNNVTLIGNLATDVEVRDVGDDKKVANFLLAVDRPTADSDADFVRITAWNRQAEVCAEFLSKGRRVAVEGRLGAAPGRTRRGRSAARSRWSPSRSSSSRRRIGRGRAPASRSRRPSREWVCAPIVIEE